MRSKKLLSLLLALALIAGLLPAISNPASAALTAIEFVNTDTGVGIKATMESSDKLYLTVLDSSALQSMADEFEIDDNNISTLTTKYQNEGGITWINAVSEAALSDAQKICNQDLGTGTVTAGARIHDLGAQTAGATLYAWAYHNSSTTAVFKEVTLNGAGKVPATRGISSGILPEVPPALAQLRELLLPNRERPSPRPA